jgi:hypothetical protein
MGSVLAFPPRSAASIQKQPAAGLTASIVIFPGVRYERHDDAPQQVRPARGEGRGEKPQPRH